jgi:hypothetical protein
MVLMSAINKALQIKFVNYRKAVSDCFCLPWWPFASTEHIFNQLHANTSYTHSIKINGSNCFKYPSYSD